MEMDDFKMGDFRKEKLSMLNIVEKKKNLTAAFSDKLKFIMCICVETSFDFNKSCDCQMLCFEVRGADSTPCDLPNEYDIR